jgi:hypothetical protein
MRVSVPLLALALCAGPAAAQSQAVAVINAERDLREAESRRFAAMMRADTTELGRYLAAELVYTHSNAMVESRADHQGAVASGKTVYESIAPVELKYQVYAEYAVGTGTVKSKGTLNGTAFDVMLRVTTVHVKRAGRWQLVAWQSTRMP